MSLLKLLLIAGIVYLVWKHFLEPKTKASAFASIVGPAWTAVKVAGPLVLAAGPHVVAYLLGKNTAAPATNGENAVNSAVNPPGPQQPPASVHKVQIELSTPPVNAPAGAVAVPGIVPASTGTPASDKVNAPVTATTTAAPASTLGS